MKYIPRLLAQSIEHALTREKSVLLLGARQTGKTTLLKQFKADLSLSLMQPAIRQRYEQMPHALITEAEALAETKLHHQPIIWIDEVQKVPALLDAIQDLIDRKIAKFLLTGSSARKLRAQSTPNWLPGRLVLMRLDPLLQTELQKADTLLSLETILAYGTLPGIVTLTQTEDKEIDLQSYVTAYLEEEVRAEALVRKIAPFSTFLRLAASESGQIVNFRKLSQIIGVAHTTIADYYQILEDCLIVERVEALSVSKTRRRLTKTPKYLFFDLGIRRISAKEASPFPQAYWGQLFEQWVGLELIHYLRSTHPSSSLYFWRDANGPEVDWILKFNDRYLPIEVKWTDQPNTSDIKHLLLFQQEYPHTFPALLVCRVPRKMKLAPGVYACPWQNLTHEISTLLTGIQ